MKPKRQEVELAVFGKRFVALLVDGIVQGFIIALIHLGVGMGGVGNSLQLLLAMLYGWYFLTRHDGQTPGKKLMNIRVIKEDGSAIGDGDAIIRVLVGWISGAVFLIGYIWALFDQRNQTWHDKAVGSLVVNA
ncbi:MAG: RDD family protein [Anaerolineae bacterium]|nr:RDD family protein [Anaerolineae bacterium]